MEILLYGKFANISSINAKGEYLSHGSVKVLSLVDSRSPSYEHYGLVFHVE